MGKKAIGMLAVLMTGTVLTVNAQTPTVTNADLEKYREKRLAAERELRENYEELGFPSPEELLDMESRSRRERAKIVSELRERDAELARQEQMVFESSAGGAAAFGYPNPEFVDYGGRYAPSYLYYTYYNPYLIRTGTRYYKEPPRFRTFWRMWRKATGGVDRRRPGRRR